MREEFEISVDIPSIVAVSKNFSNDLKLIEETMNSETENTVLEGYKKLQLRLKICSKRFLSLVSAAKNMYWIAKKLKDDILALKKAKVALLDEVHRYQQAKWDKYKVAYFSKEEENKVRYEIKKEQENLIKKKKEVEKLKDELIIRQEELQTAIQDTNLAKSSYYHLSDAEIKLFEEQREKILKGIERYGSISLACKNDKSITMRVSSIMHYAKKHNQFNQDIEIAKQVFKDTVDAELIDRALNGTTNPVFQKGEYIGDYATKDNKLLLELAKAKMPEQYNPRAYAAANPQGPAGTTVNIVSFAGVDETKQGYTRNIGVVQNVDDTGRVERITQTKKMIDFYKDKGNAEIIEAEIVEKEDGQTD